MGTRALLHSFFLLSLFIGRIAFQVIAKLVFLSGRCEALESAFVSVTHCVLFTPSYPRDFLLLFLIISLVYPDSIGNAH